tara:strand:+ start:2662 stop:2880 length:219 start_codon:yes stop_codon:yes gene_type:complete
MSKHQEVLEKRYSEILIRNIEKQPDLVELGPEQMSIIHSALMQFFGDTLTEKRVKSTLRRVIENAGKSKERE